MMRSPREHTEFARASFISQMILAFFVLHNHPEFVQKGIFVELLSGFLEGVHEVAKPAAGVVGYQLSSLEGQPPPPRLMSSSSSLLLTLSSPWGL